MHLKEALEHLRTAVTDANNGISKAEEAVTELKGNQGVKDAVGDAKEAFELLQSAYGEVLDAIKDLT